MQLIKHVCQMLQELLLVSLGWKIFSQSHLRIINVVLTPQSKTHLQEGNARITIIASGKGRIKIQMSLLKLRVRPIRKVSFLTFALFSGFMVITVKLDVIRYRCLPVWINVIPAQNSLFTPPPHRSHHHWAARRHTQVDRNRLLSSVPCCCVNPPTIRYRSSAAPL